MNKQTIYDDNESDVLPQLAVTADQRLSRFVLHIVGKRNCHDR